MKNCILKAEGLWKDKKDLPCYRGIIFVYAVHFGEV